AGQTRAEDAVVGAREVLDAAAGTLQQRVRRDALPGDAQHTPVARDELRDDLLKPERWQPRTGSDALCDDLRPRGEIVVNTANETRPQACDEEHTDHAKNDEENRGVPQGEPDANREIHGAPIVYPTPRTVRISSISYGVSILARK